MSWLTRAQIDSVIEAMSADDLISAMGDGTSVQGVKMPADAFNLAAARLGISNGTSATQSVRMGDFKYLADKITKAVNVDSPLSDAPTGLQDSAATGE